jgi:hypothetical protein
MVPNGDNPIYRRDLYYLPHKTLLANFEVDPTKMWSAWQIAKANGLEDLQKALQSLMPKTRFYACVIDRADKTPTVKFWPFGSQIAEQLIAELTENDLTDKENGFDIKLSVKDNTAKFKQSSITVAKKPSPLGIEGEIVLPDLDKYMKTVDSVAELQKEFDSAVVEVISDFAPSKKKEEVKKETPDAEQAFEKLFNS